MNGKPEPPALLDHIADIKNRPARQRILAEKPVNARTKSHDGAKQTQFIQDRQSGGLQDQA
jgi:hypothetical protein